MNTNMIKDCIQNNLEKITLILIIAVIFQTEYGYTLTFDMIKKINRCSVDGNTRPNQNQDRSMDTNEILNIINYPSGFKMYHPLFKKFLDMTAKKNRPSNKCLIYFCLSQLQLMGMNNSIASENKNTKSYLDIKSKPRLSIEYDFVLSYVLHLEYAKGVLMNPSTFCLYEMCLVDVERAGYNVLDSVNRSDHYEEYEEWKSSAGIKDSSQERSYRGESARFGSFDKISYFMFFRKFLEFDYGQLVWRYTRQYLSDENTPNTTNIYDFCVRTMCEEELKYGSFDYESDGNTALNYFEAERHFMSIYDIFSFVNSYSNYLYKKIEKKTQKSSISSQDEGTDKFKHVSVNSSTIVEPAKYCTIAP